MGFLYSRMLFICVWFKFYHCSLEFKNFCGCCIFLHGNVQFFLNRKQRKLKVTLVLSSLQLECKLHIQKLKNIKNFQLQGCNFILNTLGLGCDALCKKQKKCGEYMSVFEFQILQFYVVLRCCRQIVVIIYKRCRSISMLRRQNFLNRQKNNFDDDAIGAKRLQIRTCPPKPLSSTGEFFSDFAFDLKYLVGVSQTLKKKQIYYTFKVGNNFP
eukprot:TRINITY_DN27261_c0_g1_i1.p2 TRINITY_DN27261_c0_g1~~TRINITY_DN27261_c0_g1_i1.p2  ORF type:complete len:213 (+),score=-4.67 TRINITY_DN27261_c0_g1_i1:170-808(+)